MGRAVAVALVIGGLLGCSSGDDTTGDDTTRADTASAATEITATGTTETVTGTTAPDGSLAPGETLQPMGSSAQSEVSTVLPESTAPMAPPASDGPADPVTPAGFDLVRATVTTADGEVCDLCLWVASTASERRQGLMGVTDLGAGDGMAFVYDAPHTGSFWMKNTPLPLSIAFFDVDGQYLDAFDMEPCTAEPCPLYPTAPAFLVAIETEQGVLGELGIVDGSQLDLTDLPCE